MGVALSSVRAARRPIGVAAAVWSLATVHGAPANAQSTFFARAVTYSPGHPPTPVTVPVAGPSGSLLTVLRAPRDADVGLRCAIPCSLTLPPATYRVRVETTAPAQSWHQTLRLPADAHEIDVRPTRARGYYTGVWMLLAGGTMALASAAAAFGTVGVCIEGCNPQIVGDVVAIEVSSIVAAVGAMLAGAAFMIAHHHTVLVRHPEPCDSIGRAQAGCVGPQTH